MEEVNANEILAAREINNFTKRGKCSNCGECCTNILPMSRHEIKAIKQYVKKNKIDPEPISDTLNLSCPFRDDQAKKCKIYEVRPWICRRFMCNDKTPHTGTTKKLQVVNVREEFFGGKPWPWMKID